ncbi:hypothetical protein [Amphritea sp.]|uniref:hypothetical protein n=1 Tax=Amphritea sp. TaxID=1872502 RepID=UPI0025C5A685|nr:hypothetical protein [Amphritea sp.]
MTEVINKQVFRLFVTLGVLIHTLTGCQSLQDVSAPSVVTTVVESGALHLIGPFKTANDQVTIRAIFIEKDDDGLIKAGESINLGNFAFVWLNDEIVFSVGDEDETRLLSTDKVIPMYDYLAYRGYCLRKSNGSFSIILGGNYSGTVNASRPADLYFIYFDHATNQVSFKTVTEDFLHTKGCVDTIDDFISFREEALESEKQLLLSLQPQSHSEDQLEGRDFEEKSVALLPQDPRPAIQKHFQMYRRYYQSEQCQDEEYKELNSNACLQSNSQFSLVAKHSTYEIHRLEFILDCSSKGLDLLYLTEENSWYNLYSIPTGCSKHFLFYPVYQELGSEEVSMELCTYCMHWGTWEGFVLDFSKMLIRKADE